MKTALLIRSVCPLCFKIHEHVYDDITLCGKKGTIKYTCECSKNLESFWFIGDATSERILTILTNSPDSPTSSCIRTLL